ncbi:hypothetical protein ACPA9J_19215 [Pseudomonas aeruginosa]
MESIQCTVDARCSELEVTIMRLRFVELKELIEKLEKATNPATSGNLESLRLLDSRYQLSFFAEEVEKGSKRYAMCWRSSSGKSGGEKSRLPAR